LWLYLVRVSNPEWLPVPLVKPEFDILEQSLLFEAKGVFKRV
jgi:hypothetical protein